MSSSLLNIGTQALTANQSALAYTGQNIANVNTDGYSRQRVNFETQAPPILGVAIQDVQRITDQFLVEQVWRDQSALSSTEQQSKKIALLDKLMVSDATNLSSALDDYFTALQRVVDDPLFVANRELFLSEAQTLVSRFNDFDRRLVDQQNALTVEARSLVSSVNSISSSIAQLNVKISSLASSGQNYNSLIDERDQLVKDLSKYVSIDVVSSDGGVTTNVLLANGEPLVSSARAARLAVADGSPDPLQVKVTLSRGNTEADVTNLLGEGALGGIFSYRDEVLQPTRSEIGRLALVFATTMNEQHRKGMDLNGDMGGDLFNTPSTGQVYGRPSNQTQGVNTRLSFYDVGALTSSDYQVQITGLNTFRVTRLSDGEIFDSRNMQSLSEDGAVSEFGSFSRTETATRQTLSISLDGFTFTLNSSEPARQGDIWLMQPTKNGAKDMSLALTEPQSLALASPLRVTPGDENTGNASLVSVEVLDASSLSPLRPGQLEPPIEIVFNTPTTNEFGESIQTFSVFDMTDPDNPQPFEGVDSLIYRSGEPIVVTVNNSQLYQLTFANQPKPGDSFAVEYNKDGYSDNTNALAMSALQTAPTARGYSYQDAYGQLLAKVGTQANTAEVSYMANLAVLSASEDALESVRGVNLDEEAAKLIQYQQAYTASTRLITAYQDLFDSLISAVR